MIEKRKTPWSALFALLGLGLVMGYFIGGIFTYPDAGLDNFDTLLTDVFLHPFRNYLNEMTLTVEGLILFGWIFLLSWYLQHHRDTHSDIECGSAEWADVHAVNRQLADKNDSKNNRILSKNLRISLDGPNALSNNNGIYIGSPGTGKSMMMITPNLLNMASSYVFLDVKGELLGKYGNYLDHHGYDIKVLNLRDMEKSNCYNPFNYIASEDDIPRLIMNIFKSVEPPDAAKSDPFWDDGCALYLQSIFYFVWMVPWEMKKDKCVVLLEGTQPIFDSKYRPFEDTNFKEAMSYGPYVHPVRVRRNRNGIYETLGVGEVMGRLLTDANAVAYYRKEAEKKGSGIRIYELTEEELLAVDIPEYDPAETNRIQEQKQMEMVRNLEEAREMHVEAIVQAAVEAKQEEYIRLLQNKGPESDDLEELPDTGKWKLEGEDPLELIMENIELLDDDQIEQIRLGWSHGLTISQIKRYFTQPANRMRIMREILEEQNRRSGRNTDTE